MIPTFKSMIIALIRGFVAGIIGILITYLLFLDFQRTNSFHFIEIAGMLFLTVLLSVAFCGAVLFPISIFEKESDKTVPAETLFRRYLPFITLPLFTVFCLLIFSHDGSECYQDTDYYFCLKALIIAFCIGTTELWTFLKNTRA